MNTEIQETFMHELAAHVKGLTAVLPALAMAAALAGKGYMETEMLKLKAMSEDISGSVDEADSQEMKRFLADKEQFSEAMEKIKGVSVDGPTLQGVRILVGSAPAVLSRAAIFMNNHAAELIRILDEQAKEEG